MKADLTSRYERLLAETAKYGPLVAVAFSGGVDSSLLFKAALDVFGRTARGLFASSPLIPGGELALARELAESIGGGLTVVEVSPLNWSAFVENPVNRCYHCKKTIYTTFLARLNPPDAEPGLPEYSLLDGTNLDDLSTERPGRRALKELQVKTPLADAGLDKGTIRQLARILGLKSWNKYPSSCLATRIPTGMAITARRLALIDRLEKILIGLDFPGCRVRLSASGDDEVRIDLRNRHEDLAGAAVRTMVTEEFSKNGVKSVSLNLTP